MTTTTQHTDVYNFAVLSTSKQLNELLKVKQLPNLEDLSAVNGKQIEGKILMKRTMFCL